MISGKLFSSLLFKTLTHYFLFHFGTFFLIVGTLEYDKFDEIVEKSYLYAKPIVDEWVRKNPWLVSQIKDID